MRPIFLILVLMLFCSCRGQELLKPPLNKNIRDHNTLIKDTSLFNFITYSKEKTSFLYKGSPLTILKKDSLQWRKSFFCRTPTTSFWEKNKNCEDKQVQISNDKNLPLAGIRIALDAGHLAGTPLMAEIEGKQIRLKHPSTHDSIFFYEGELTFLTVSLLEDSLSKLGATVFTTRKPNESALGYTYFEWLKKYFNSDLDSCLKNEVINEKDFLFLLKEKKKNTLRSKKIIFHKLFKHLDFYHRAKMINQFQPDFTVIVHYNVDVKNKGWNKPTKDNFNMAFVPGAFMKGELEKQIDFNHLIRLSQTNEINESIIFSSCILKELKKHTKVDIIDDFSEISYLNNYCLPTIEKGVFSRNLALTRQIKGTLCYIEALYQDNFEESILLSNKAANGYYPKRVQDVSNGIFEGIINYLSIKNYQK